MAKLIHPELSYQVKGILLDVYNSLGPSLKEAVYETAIAIGLEKRKIPFETQKEFDVYYRDERVGLYAVDVWVNGGNIVLELKVAPNIIDLHKAQVLSYLKVTDADLGIVANFGSTSFEDERLPNFLRGKAASFQWKEKSLDKYFFYPELSNEIYKSLYTVHNTLGPGFLHKVYRKALIVELRMAGLCCDFIPWRPIYYEGQFIENVSANLILVEDKILISAYAVSEKEDNHSQQLWAYMRRHNFKLGFAANFHGTSLNIKPIRIMQESG